MFMFNFVLHVNDVMIDFGDTNEIISSRLTATFTLHICFVKNNIKKKKTIKMKKKIKTTKNHIVRCVFASSSTPVCILFFNASPKCNLIMTRSNVILIIYFSLFVDFIYFSMIEMLMAITSTIRAWNELGYFEFIEKKIKNEMEWWSERNECKKELWPPTINGKQNQFIIN